MVHTLPQIICYQALLIWPEKYPYKNNTVYAGVVIAVLYSFHFTETDSFLISHSITASSIDRVIFTVGTLIIPLLNEDLQNKFNGRKKLICF